MNNSELTDEQVVMLQLRIISALSFYRQRPEKEAKNMADLLMLCGAAVSELQERRKVSSEPIAIVTNITSHNGGIPFGQIQFTRKFNQGERVGELYAAPVAKAMNGQGEPEQ